MVILRRLVRKNRRAGAKQTVHMQSLIAQMTDVLISIKPLKAMAREKQSDVVLTDTTRRLNRALQKQVLSKAALGSFQEPLTMVFLVLCLYIALSYWDLSPTAIIAMVFFIGKTLKQIEKIQKEYVNLVEYDSAYWSLLEKIEGAPERPGTVHRDAATGLRPRGPDRRRQFRLWRPHGVGRRVAGTPGRVLFGAAGPFRFREKHARRPADRVASPTEG